MRKSDSAARGVPQIVVPASPSAFKNAKVGTSSIRPPEIQKVSRQEVLSSLKGMAIGWDKTIEDLFAMPERLFKIQEDSATYYSKSESFGITAVLDGLQSGKLPTPLPEYGLCLYSTGGSVHLVLIDGARNIVVRNRLFSVHDSQPEKEWAPVKESIRSALAVSAGARKEGGVAVFDGMLRIMRPG